jgi:ectoine hydroxylase-related dioxygenase (phytanoyl-CoA dioxygenase family)
MATPTQPAANLPTGTTDVASMSDAFDREGYLVVERVLDARQLREAEAGVRWAMGNVPGEYKWIKQRSYEWFREHPIFAELIEHPLVMDFARHYLGPDVRLIAAQCSRNTREDHYAPGVMQIHQDACFFAPPGASPPGVPEHRYGFSAMWYLQDTPLDMGPTELVPGAHLDGQRQHTNDSLTADHARIWRAAIPAGSLLFFNHRTWHRGAPNRTDRPRDLITNAYARGPVIGSQITTKIADGSMKYVPPTDLLPRYSPTLRALLERA